MSTPRFLVDAMLGKLAKWLRIMGYDTLYDVRWDDDEIARRARAEGRVILTRDTGLVQRKGLRVLFIESERWQEQVAQVLSAYGAPGTGPFSRCPVDNTPLREISRELAARRVPPYVFQTQDRFRECATCGRIFWRGTHWERMQAKLKTLDG